MSDCQPVSRDHQFNNSAAQVYPLIAQCLFHSPLRVRVRHSPTRSPHATRHSPLATQWHSESPLATTSHAARHSAHSLGTLSRHSSLATRHSPLRLRVAKPLATRRHQSPPLAATPHSVATRHSESPNHSPLASVRVSHHHSPLRVATSH
jgi:hypothetical protein